MALAYDHLGGKWSNDVIESLGYYQGSSIDEVDTAILDWNYKDIIPTLVEESDPNDQYVGFFDIRDTEYVAWANHSPNNMSDPYAYCSILFDLDDMETYPYNTQDGSRWVANHEIGHCFGLAHYTGSGSSVMYQGYDNASGTASTIDCAAVDELYE